MLSLTTDTSYEIDTNGITFDSRLRLIEDRDTIYTYGFS